MKNKIENVSTWTIVLFICAFSLGSMWIYTKGHLSGNIDSHIQTSKKFGIPETLRKKGIKPFFQGPEESGWDGQFYYFMANDLLGGPETIKHIDWPAYRYQRIGLPALSKLTSIVLLQSWVNPATYYLTSLILILLATFISCQYFTSKTTQAYVTLFWSLGMGTQLTLLNGLPDAAADSLLIIALVSYARKKYLFYIVSISLTVLTREAYFLFPVLFILYHLVQQKWALMKPHLAPILIFTLWHTYIRLHFDIMPSQEAEGILNFPLFSTIQYLYLSLSNHHPLMPSLGLAMRESILIVIFLVLVIIALKVSISLTTEKSKDTFGLTVGSTTICLGIIYLCFGPMVMMHFTGYLKAANIFLFLIPFVLSLKGEKLGKKMIYFLTLVTVLNLIILFNDGILAPYPY